MGYKDRSFASRRGVLGDVAEAKFEEVYGKPFVRFGISRPDDQGVRVQDLPHRLRHTPDYLVAGGLVECLGSGRDGIVKLGLTKLSCLLFWNSVAPVSLFCWNSTKKKHALVTLDQVMKLIDAGQATLGTFVEQKSYFGLPFDALLAVSE